MQAMMQEIAALNCQVVNIWWRQTSALSLLAGEATAQRGSFSIPAIVARNANCTKVPSRSKSHHLHVGSCSDAAGDLTELCSGVTLKHLQCCGRDTRKRRHAARGHAIRAGTSAEEPIFEDGDLYEAPDAYGGQSPYSLKGASLH